MRGSGEAGKRRKEKKDGRRKERKDSRNNKKRKERFQYRQSTGQISPEVRARRKKRRLEANQGPEKGD